MEVEDERSDQRLTPAAGKSVRDPPQAALFRSWNRGTQESDLILGSFAETSLADFDRTQLDRFEALLDCSDPDLFDWMFGVGEPPAKHDHDVMRRLRDFCAAPRSMRQYGYS